MTQKELSWIAGSPGIFRSQTWVVVWRTGLEGWNRGIGAVVDGKTDVKRVAMRNRSRMKAAGIVLAITVAYLELMVTDKRCHLVYAMKAAVLECDAQTIDGTCRNESLKWNEDIRKSR